MIPAPSMVDTPAALADLVARCTAANSIALDTEFVWERTYYPRLGLVQVALETSACYLIDAVALDDLTPLAALLQAPDLIKILHDAPQDLMILRRATGAYPANVYDTRCAAGLAGLSSTTSLAELVAATVGVELAKTESRTNWLRRPLTAEQVAYAAEDVGYLHAVRGHLQARVGALGRGAWLAAELATLADPGLYQERDPRLQYQRLKGAGGASRRELAVLRELAAWREEEARRCDRPRRRVVEDEVLLRVAARRPRSAAALAELRGVASRYTSAILGCVARGLSRGVAENGRRRPRRVDEERVEALVAAAMLRLRACAQAENIDAPFIASRAEVRAVMAAGPAADPAQHRVLRGWRREVFGQQLLDLTSRRAGPTAAGCASRA